MTCLQPLALTDKTKRRHTEVPSQTQVPNGKAKQPMHRQHTPLSRSLSSRKLGLRKLLWSSFFVAYPLVVYFGRHWFSTRGVAWLMICLSGPLTLVGQKQPEVPVSGAALLPLVATLLAGCSLYFELEGLLFWLPVVTNLLLLISFASTLCWDMPMIERFARLIDGELSFPQMQWCRRWTVIWCLFFAGNATVTALLAMLASPFLWTLHTSVLSYLLMACLFATEWMLRRRRFPRRSTVSDAHLRDQGAHSDP